LQIAGVVHVLDIESYVKENEFDYIIMEIYPYNINGDAKPHPR